ncbi:hypothetical protein [Phascolarctobacterium faecium]
MATMPMEKLVLQAPMLHTLSEIPVQEIAKVTIYMQPYVAVFIAGARTA